MIILNQQLLITITAKNDIIPGLSQEADRIVSAKIKQQLQKKVKDVLTGIGCLDCIFSLQVIAWSKPYQTPLRHVAYALQKPFKQELEKLQQQI